MRETFTIRLPYGGKRKIHRDTYHAIKRAIRTIPDDKRVAAYAAAPSEGIDHEIVAIIRQRMTISGELPSRAYSRRLAR